MPSTVSATTGPGTGGSQPAPVCLGGYTDIPTIECDMLAQDCEPGFGCVATAGSNGFGSYCLPHPGLKGNGDPCFSDASCKAGLYCVFDKCSPICCPQTNEPCGEGGICNVDSPLGGFNASVCSFLATCTLFTGECAAGTQCYPLMDDGNSVCAPIQGATVGEGQPCGAINECDDSMVCIDQCRWACFLDGQGLMPGAGGCPVGQTCTMTGTNPPQNVGACM